jgi:hypothetical protein
LLEKLKEDRFATLVVELSEALILEYRPKAFQGRKALLFPY